MIALQLIGLAGHDHYPVPWGVLKYDTNLGGYRTNVSKEQLDGAPKYANDDDWDWSAARFTITTERLGAFNF